MQQEIRVSMKNKIKKNTYKPVTFGSIICTGYFLFDSSKNNKLILSLECENSCLKVALHVAGKTQASNIYKVYCFNYAFFRAFL